MIRYEKPIIKTAADMTETHYHRKGHTQSETCYSMTNIRKVIYEVVGRE